MEFSTSLDQRRALAIDEYLRQKQLGSAPKFKVIPRNSKRQIFVKRRSYFRQETSLQDVSIPGFKYLLMSRSSFWRKAIWAIAILTSTVLCVYQVSTRLTYYLSYPISTGMDITRNTTIRFPDFTICPFDINSMPAIRRLQFRYANESNGETFENVFKLTVYENISLREIWSLNSINENNANIELKINKQLPMKKNPSITLNKAMAYLGGCLIIHIDGDVDFLGPALVLSIQQEVDQDVQYGDTSAFTIYPHEAGAPAKHHAFFKGQIVQRSYITAIALSYTTFKVINSANKPCINPLESDFCWVNCVEKIFHQKAICKLPYMNGNKAPCSSPEDALFTYNINLDVYLSIHQDDCNCSRKCIDNIYNLDMDVRSYTPNLTKVEIFFPMNTFTVITEYYSYSFITLMCDIGGNLGLYLGSCLLTFLELIEALIINIMIKNGKVIDW